MLLPGAARSLSYQLALSYQLQIQILRVQSYSRTVPARVASAHSAVPVCQVVPMCRAAAGTVSHEHAVFEGAFGAQFT